MLEIQTVFRQSFPAAQLFEFLPKERMKRVHYAEPLQPWVTTVCSAYPSLTASTIERTIRSLDPGNDGVGTVPVGFSP